MFIVLYGIVPYMDLWNRLGWIKLCGVDLKFQDVANLNIWHWYHCIPYNWISSEWFGLSPQTTSWSHTNNKSSVQRNVAIISFKFTVDSTIYILIKSKNQFVGQSSISLSPNPCRWKKSTSSLDTALSHLLQYDRFAFFVNLTLSTLNEYISLWIPDSLT